MVLYSLKTMTRRSWSIRRVLGQVSKSSLRLKYSLKSVVSFSWQNTALRTCTRSDSINNPSVGFLNLKWPGSFFKTNIFIVAYSLMRPKKYFAKNLGRETCYLVLRQVQRNCSLADFKVVSFALAVVQNNKFLGTQNSNPLKDQPWTRRAGRGEFYFVWTLLVENIEGSTLRYPAEWKPPKRKIK